jgi:hypothetical protein
VCKAYTNKIHTQDILSVHVRHTRTKYTHKTTHIRHPVRRTCMEHVKHYIVNIRLKHYIVNVRLSGCARLVVCCCISVYLYFCVRMYVGFISVFPPVFLYVYVRMCVCLFSCVCVRLRVCSHVDVCVHKAMCVFTC